MVFIAEFHCICRHDNVKPELKRECLLSRKASLFKICLYRLGTRIYSGRQEFAPMEQIYNLRLFSVGTQFIERQTGTYKSCLPEENGREKSTNCKNLP